MTIAKSAILTEVNARTGQNYTGNALDGVLLSIMLEVSHDVPGMLQQSANVTVGTDGTGPLPVDYVRWESVYDSSIPRELTPAGGTGDVKVIKNYYTADDDTGNPRLFAVGDKLYVWPPPASNRVIALTYDYADNDVNDIAAPDLAKEALIEGACHKVELGKGIQPAEITIGAQSHYILYRDQIAMLERAFAHRVSQANRPSRKKAAATPSINLNLQRARP